jgi:uroporphyrinogen decarboxylase
MTSRERILMTMDHKQPDRVAIDFNGHRSSGIVAPTYIKLREELGLPPSKLYIYDFIQQLALVEDDVLDIIGADVVEVGHDYDKSMIIGRTGICRMGHRVKYRLSATLKRMATHGL